MMYSQAIDRATINAADRVLKQGSKSFFLASRCLPKAPRTAAALFYTFCRRADDYIDEGVVGNTENRLTSLRHYVDTLYQSPEQSADEAKATVACGFQINQRFDNAFAVILRRYQVPKSILMAMIEGFEWDLSGRQYQDQSDIVEYALRVAGTVGIVMALIFGARKRDTLRSAARLGVAMQLTNIARDVGEDHARDRCYLPAELLLLHGVYGLGIKEQTVKHTQGLAAVIRTLLDTADGYYGASEAGIRSLPASIQSAIWMARFTYSAIGDKIAAGGYDSINRRHYLTKADKLAFLGPALAKTVHVKITTRNASTPMANGTTVDNLPGDFLLRDFVDIVCGSCV